MEQEPFALVNVKNHDGIDKLSETEEEDSKSRELRIHKRVKELTKPSDIGQENSTDRDDRYHCLVQRLERIERVIETLTPKKRTPSPTERGPNDTSYEGDIRADIRTIISKEKTDPATADRWKAVFLDRYGLHWGVDCGSHNELSSVAKEMIRLFNIRARVMYGWNNNRTQILDICDDWVSRWRCGQVPYIPSKDYRQLCRLYYT
ncbi:hypothetical protein N7519_002618 [Penicillium mononematosum]|uniref:uncharacterized protein n=1 Tax=Penicillium mononematosum TaxID=268346 RepID=UPI002548471F|nr:uncharacterized protein N7519_002618 [Penicillium mononematosum]KAJ6187710.1 hypothetical protein N7519_002618 [Penicillium mononematosum]